MSHDRRLIRAIGNQLQAARHRHGWSRPDLVRRLPTQTPVNTYACYEQGLREAPLERLVEICTVLGVSPAALLDQALATTSPSHSGGPPWICHPWPAGPAPSCSGSPGASLSWPVWG